jgi:hypothetical protein
MQQAYNIVYIHAPFGITYCTEKDIHGRHLICTDSRHDAIKRVTALRMAGFEAWFEPNTAENRKRYNCGIMHR